MPKTAADALKPSLDHWKMLADKQRTQMFRPTLEQMEFIQPLLKTPENK